jgi:hypothetical protein
MRTWIVYSSILLFFSCKVKNNSQPASTTNAAQNTTQLLNDQTYLLTKISKDATYAFSYPNPVKVGGAMNSSGPINEKRFLNALLGPKGEKVEYFRTGTCCAFKTNTQIGEYGLLDVYKVWLSGSPDTLIMYLDNYHAEELFIPFGFTAKK